MNTSDQLAVHQLPLHFVSASGHPKNSKRINIRVNTVLTLKGIKNKRRTCSVIEVEMSKIVPL